MNEEELAEKYGPWGIILYRLWLLHRSDCYRTDEKIDLDQENAEKHGV